MIEHTFRSRWDSIINVKHGTPPGFVELGISHPQLSPRTVTLDPAIAAELGHALIGDTGRELSQLRAANDELQRRVDELQAQRHTHDQGDRHLSVDLSHAIEQRDEAQALWHEAAADRDTVLAKLARVLQTVDRLRNERDDLLAERAERGAEMDERARQLDRVTQANEAGAEQVNQLTAALSSLRSELHDAQSEADTIGQVLDTVTDVALQVVHELNESAVGAMTSNPSWLLSNPAATPRGEQFAWQATGAARVRSVINGVIEDARRDGLTWGGER
jgi:DNA repair exonuclease SbcCD ATPase subunit